MSEIKVVVMYPTPTDEAHFEKVYFQEHMPLAAAKIKGMTRITTSKVLGTPDGSPPKYSRLAELYFPSMDALQASMASASTQEAVAHAVAISTGGPPMVLI